MTSLDLFLQHLDERTIREWFADILGYTLTLPLIIGVFLILNEIYGGPPTNNSPKIELNNNPQIPTMQHFNDLVEWKQKFLNLDEIMQQQQQPLEIKLTIEQQLIKLTKQQQQELNNLTNQIHQYQDLMHLAKQQQPEAANQNNQISPKIPPNH